MGLAASSGAAPSLGGYHHIGLTVPDIEKSEAWYGRVLGLTRAFVEPHNGGGTGYAVVLNRPGSPLFLGLDMHHANEGEQFAESRTGLDHLSIAVAERQDLDAWIAHFDREVSFIPASPNSPSRSHSPWWSFAIPTTSNSNSSGVDRARFSHR